MTIRVTIALDDLAKGRLDALAVARNASPEDLAAQAVEQMLDEEAAFEAAMDEAEADLAAGRTFSNEQVLAEVRAVIASSR